MVLLKSLSVLESKVRYLQDPLTGVPPTQTGCNGNCSTSFSVQNEANTFLICLIVLRMSVSCLGLISFRKKMQANQMSNSYTCRS